MKETLLNPLEIILHLVAAGNLLELMPDCSQVKRLWQCCITVYTFVSMVLINLVSELKDWDC